jgi:hypothetical protein
MNSHFLVNKPKDGYGRNVLLESGSHAVERSVKTMKNLA